MTKRNKEAMGEFGIKIPRTYDATPERVFRAWTDPASVRAWLASGELAIVDPRENGLFYIGMPVSERIVPHYGRYLRVENPRLLEFTWVSEYTQGKESVVLIELTARGKQTELTLTHDGLPSEELAEAHNGGWTDFLDQLIERLR